jgi:hypothetical protein
MVRYVVIVMLVCVCGCWNPPEYDADDRVPYTVDEDGVGLEMHKFQCEDEIFEVAVPKDYTPEQQEQFGKGFCKFAIEHPNHFKME